MGWHGAGVQDGGKAGARSGVRGCQRPDRSSNGQMGVGYCRQDGGGGVLGWDTRQWMGWGSRHMVGFQKVVGFQSCGGIPDTGGVPDKDGGVPDRDGGYQTGMVGYQTGGGIPDAGGSIPGVAGYI